MKSKLALLASGCFAGLVCAKIARHIACAHIVSVFCVKFVRCFRFRALFPYFVFPNSCEIFCPGIFCVNFGFLAEVFPEFLKKKEAKKKELDVNVVALLLVSLVFVISLFSHLLVHVLYFIFLLTPKRKSTKRKSSLDFGKEPHYFEW